LLRGRQAGWRGWIWPGRKICGSKLPQTSAQASLRTPKEGPIKFERILFPTDFSEASLEALPYGVELAALFNAELLILHVVPALPPMPSDAQYTSDVAKLASKLRSDAEAKLHESMQGKIPGELKTRRLLVQGRAAERILSAIGEYQADLLVISTHGLTGWRHVLMGSVAEKVVRMSPIPVLSIRAKAKS
jgi:nucleotide-binding universal stress UspA family protein